MMTRTTRKTLAVPLVLAGMVASCAVNRSHVKSLRDQQAHDIQFETPIPTTIKALGALPSHCGPALDHRSHPEELRVYEVVGRITRVAREPDHDIHIVLEDPADTREHLVVESDDPDYRGSAESPYREKLAAARRMLEDLQRQTGARELGDLQGLVVRVTGVGFYDMNHFQVGRSRSCLELHPILTIEQIGTVRLRSGGGTPVYRRGPHAWP